MKNKAEDKLKQELSIFNNQTNIHELPEIFHYWSNKHLKPLHEEYGISHPDDLFANYMFESALSCNSEKPLFLSIGSGNCDTEVRVAKLLKKKGLQEFSIECIELNPNMLKRGYELAKQEDVLENMSFIERDFNKWKSEKEYTSVIANQSLHHVQNLEGLFREIKSSLGNNGSFIVSDIIGRNGHQRWPEALDAVNTFWEKLPKSYTYNHQLKRHEPVYENWDCSTEGFEGIRAQDILPLLVKNFHFQLFIGFSNVIDIFIDRGFGHNFKVENEQDRHLIDKIHKFDETSIRNGMIKPTHMMASMKKNPVKNPRYSRGLTPEYCIRDPHLDSYLPKSSRRREDMLAKTVLDQTKEYDLKFQNAKPYKHLCIDNFFEDEIAKNLIKYFPEFSKKHALNEFGNIGGKAVVSNISVIGDFYKEFYQYICSEGFLESISKLTGIPDLLADSELYGAGTHENIHGQNLDVHVDFNYGQKNNLHRRLNILVYLNEEWEESWGGSIEVHSNPRDRDEDEVNTFLPIMNRAVIFETNEYSWHGFKRINLPENKRHLSRKCVSIYLYTKERPKAEIFPPHTTFYIQDPLPKYFISGHTLNAEDEQLIKRLIKVRDDTITMWQKRDLELNGIIEESRNHIQNLSERMKAPLLGYVRQTGVGKGIYHDGWMAKKMILNLQPHRPIRKLSISGFVPNEINKEINLSAFVDDLEVSSGKFSCGTFKWEILLPQSISKTFYFSVRADQVFIPADLGLSGDLRELSISIDFIETLHE